MQARGTAALLASETICTVRSLGSSLFSKAGVLISLVKSSFAELALRRYSICFRDFAVEQESSIKAHGCPFGKGSFGFRIESRDLSESSWVKPVSLKRLCSG